MSPGALIHVVLPPSSSRLPHVRACKGTALRGGATPSIGGRGGQRSPAFRVRFMKRANLERASLTILGDKSREPYRLTQWAPWIGLRPEAMEAKSDAESAYRKFDQPAAAGAATWGLIWLLVLLFFVDRFDPLHTSVREDARSCDGAADGARRSHHAEPRPLESALGMLRERARV